MANESSTGIEIEETGPVENKKPFEKFVADPGVKKLAQQIESLAGRDDWPADRYVRISADDAARFLWSLSDEDYELVRDWVDIAVAETDIGQGNVELWNMCLCDFMDTLEELLDVESAEGDSVDQVIAEHQEREMSSLELIEKACSIVADCVPLKSPDANIEKAFSQSSSEEINAAAQWAEDVVSTHETGGSIRDNGGTLLNVPEMIRDFFDWEKAEAKAIEVAAEAKPEAKGGESESKEDDGDGDDDEDLSKPETAAEAIIRIQEMIPTALRQLRDAESIAESRKKAHDAAKKNVEAMQDQLNTLVEELSEALTGISGGDYQLRLPLDRASNSAATASPEGAAKSGIDTDSTANSDSQKKSDADEATPVAAVAATSNVGLVAADPIAGESVAVLVADQLSARTNGKSDGAGIPQGTVDLLVDGGLGTIGLLEEHMRRRGEYWARDIKGVGPGKAEKITAALGVLRQCFPLPAVDTEPLEELILDEAAYQLGVQLAKSGADQNLPDGWSETGHQGRSLIKGYNDQKRTEELTAGAAPAQAEGGE